MKVFKFLKDILAPKKCYSCNKEGHFLCEDCVKKLYNFDEICYVCKTYSKNYEIHTKCKQGVFFDNILVLTHYKNKLIRKLIQDAKFYSKKDILEDFSVYLGDLLIKHINEEYWVFNINDFILISTPMYFLKKIMRGYNQSEIITKNTSIYTQIKYEKSIIIKQKNTKSQSSLSKKDRLKNLNNSFKINKNEILKIDKKIVIIVDDVISTGTTINEISKILKKHGTTKVIGLCIASD